MLHALHVAASRLRHRPLLERQRWLWDAVEPAWQKGFGFLMRRRGFVTHVNDDVFRLDYMVGARYERADKRTYEPEVYAEWAAALRPGVTVLDVGAHYGFFTLAAAKRVGPTGRVFAFEPSSATVAILERHIRMNGWGDRAVAVPLVAGDRDGEVTFFTFGTSMAASLGRANVKELNPERPAEVGEERVAATTLDRFCRERGLTPALLKVDVEGAELLVLRGAAGLLRAARPRVLCEVHPAQMQNVGCRVADFEAFVRDAGYRIRPLAPPNPMGIYPSWLEPDA